MNANGRLPRLSALFSLAPLLIALTVACARSVAAEPRDFEVRIEQGRVADGAGVLRVTQGDAVTIRWTSDAAMTLHLHGYDIEAVAAPGAPGRMSFQAHASGRFPVEAHEAGGGHRTLLYLEVHPR